MPCAAQNAPPLTAPIANGQSSVTVPFAPALATKSWIPIELRINGKGPYVFILDTGAAGSGVVRDVAVALDLPPAGNYKFTSASKAIITTELKAAKTVDIGAVTLNNMTLAVLDLPSNFTFQGILGADFLAQFVATVDYQRQRVTLTLPDKFAYKGKGVTLPFKLSEHGNPFIVVSIEGVQGNFLVDTGWNSGLSVSQSFVQSNHLRDKYPRHIEGQAELDLAGKPETAWYVRSDEVMLGRILPIHNMTQLATRHLSGYRDF